MKKLSGALFVLAGVCLALPLLAAGPEIKTQRKNRPAAQNRDTHHLGWRIYVPQGHTIEGRVWDKQVKQLERFLTTHQANLQGVEDKHIGAIAILGDKGRAVTYDGNTIAPGDPGGTLLIRPGNKIVTPERIQKDWNSGAAKLGKLGPPLVRLDTVAQWVPGVGFLADRIPIVSEGRTALKAWRIGNPVSPLKLEIIRAAGTALSRIEEVIPELTDKLRSIRSQFRPNDGQTHNNEATSALERLIREQTPDLKTKDAARIEKAVAWLRERTPQAQERFARRITRYIEDQRNQTALTEAAVVAGSRGKVKITREWDFALIDVGNLKKVFVNVGNPAAARGSDGQDLSRMVMLNEGNIEISYKKTFALFRGFFIDEVLVATNIIKQTLGDTAGLTRALFTAAVNHAYEAGQADSTNP